MLRRGESVAIFDNFSRRGSPKNVEWLHSECESSPEIIQGDLADSDAVQRAVASAEVIYHLGGQVAVTTSVLKPRLDFESNVLGTFNVLEAARASDRQPIVVYASTNKVYGALESAEVVEDEKRYHFKMLPYGVPEDWPLDFHSPYGCSKGAGDQYVRDYARIFGLRTVVFRQSCIFGYRQYGIEDQGWLAWMVIAAITGQPITIYGNGKQVRDILFVEDLLDAYDAAVNRIDIAAGQVYNVGGGPEHSLSVWAEFGPMLSELLDREVQVSYGPTRPGDQPLYVSDIRKAKRDLGWSPQVSVQDGLEKLVNWVRTAPELAS